MKPCADGLGLRLEIFHLIDEGLLLSHRSDLSAVALSSESGPYDVLAPDEGIVVKVLVDEIVSRICAEILVIAGEHRKIRVLLSVGPQKDRNPEFLRLFRVYVMPQAEDCIDLEFLRQPDDFLRIIPGLGNEVGHRVKDTSALGVGVFNKSVQKTSF